MQVKSKVWFEKDGRLCFGRGRARLLRAVEQTGSLSQAAKALGMSYRHAWSQVKSAEEHLGEPLLVRKRGGSSRGGAVLTAKAMRLLTEYEQLDRDVREFIGERTG
jgi:molybdate transport system regulatory protein